MTEYQPNLPIRLRKRPYLVRVWRSYKAFRQAGLSRQVALREAFWMGRAR